jgi:hypothetical protein
MKRELNLKWGRHSREGKGVGGGMKVEICERCGKPGDYPECKPPYKPRGSRSKMLEAQVSDMAALLERMLRYELEHTPQCGLQAEGQIDGVTCTCGLERDEEEARALLKRIRGEK